MSPYASRPLRIAALAARMLLGLFFLVSAGAKVFDLDRFEIYLFSYNILSLNLSFLAARIIIVLELLVGIGLVSNLCVRFVNCCTILMLTAFTLFLAYAALIGRTDSCQCMGSLVEINPAKSILKNVLLLVVFLFSMGAKPWKWRPKWYLWLIVVLAPTVSLFIFSAPDNWLFGESEELYNKEEFGKSVAPGGSLSELGLDEGRHVLAFLTPGCPYCRLADQKMTHIYRRDDLDSTRFIYVIPAGDSATAQPAIDTADYQRPSHKLDNLTFAKITYGQRPMIFLIEDGVVKESFHYRNINEKSIQAFLKEQ